MALNNVPQAGQTLSASRAPIQTNFSTIDTAFSIDHVPYGASGQGRHNRVSLSKLPNGSFVVPAAVANVFQLFTTTSALTTKQELFLKRESGTTLPTNYEFTGAAFANTGWTILPSGIILQWQRSIGFGGASSITITLNSIANFPTFTNIFSVLVTPLDTAGTFNNVIGLSDINNGALTFTVSNYAGTVPGGTVSFGYLVIGN